MGLAKCSREFILRKGLIMYGWHCHILLGVSLVYFQCVEI